MCRCMIWYNYDKHENKAVYVAKSIICRITFKQYVLYLSLLWQWCVHLGSLQGGGWRHVPIRLGGGPSPERLGLV